MTAWSEEETLKLIELWSEDSIQAMLEGIPKELEGCGFIKTGELCSCKIKKVEI